MYCLVYISHCLRFSVRF